MGLPRRQTPMPPQMWTPGRPLVVRVVLAILGGWGAAQGALWAFNLEQAWLPLMLDSQAVAGGEYWRLFSSQFIHANVIHLLANMFAFFHVGREVEPILGRRPFVGLCLAAGFIGNVANCLLFPHAPACGFSASVAAIVVAYATILPELEHQLWLGFPTTIRFRSKHLAAAVVLFAAACITTKSFLVLGPASILAGCAAGWIWARQLGFGNPFWFQRRRNERHHQDLRRQRLTAEEFLEQEIDPLLDKISREGIGSLTRAERRILEEGRGKLVRERTSQD